MSSKQTDSESGPTGPGDLETPSDTALKEPSLGPACLVVTILTLAILCSVCAFGSFFMFSDQNALAIKGIEVQLIPWIETSQLKDADKQRIIARLRKLIPELKAEKLSTRQLTRLHNCLQDNPVLIWGAVDKVRESAVDAGLSPTEQTTLNRVCQRMLRGSAERKLGRSDVEFTMQKLASVRKNGQSLEVLQPPTAEQIREFMVRGEQLVDQNGIVNEPYEFSPGEAFEKLVDAALDVPEE